MRRLAVMMIQRQVRVRELYYGTGRSMVQVAEILGISKKTVGRDVEACVQDDIEQGRAGHEHHLASQVAFLEGHIREAGRAYRESYEPKITKRIEQRKDKEGNVIGTTSTQTSEERPPDPRFLDQMLKALVEKAKLRGLYPTEKSAHVNLNIDGNELFDPKNPLRVMFFGRNGDAPSATD